MSDTPSRLTTERPPPSHSGLCPRCTAPLSRLERCDACGYQATDGRVGLVLGGKVLVEALIGAGGMGRVYRATHLELGEPLAVKFLLAQWSRMTEIRTRFRREAVALARLRHPNIVSVLDFGEHDGELYMVMELVQGETLASVLAQGPLNLLRIGAVFDPILQLLEAAHAQEIVHRDLKPENVMLVRAGEQPDHVKVLDFGLVHMPDAGGKRLTETGTVRGTPLYMSPEQCRGRDVGAPTDVYAVGVMLYEALTGAPPFDAMEVAELMAQQMFVEVPPMAERGAGRAIPRGLEMLTRSALSKRPDDRPSAHELRVGLAAALHGTDAYTLADRAAAERERMAAMSRSERAFTGITEKKEPGPEPGRATVRALLWMPAGPRAETLRAALGVHGIRARVWAGDDFPTARSEGEPVEVILVPGLQGADRTSRLRAGAATARVPALVFDVLDAPATAALIRAGASDVALSSVGDEEVCRKVLRLVKRKA